MTIRSTRLLNLRGQGSWYTIKNQAAGPTQIHIFDEIGYVGVTAQQFTTDLANIQGDIELHLNTPGGEVFDGIAIYNALRPRQPVIHVDSLAASIGSVIAMAAGPGKLIMGKNSTMMIHDGFGMTVGNAQDMRKMADVLDKTSDNIASIYADRTGKPASEWRNLMRNETWFTAEEAVAAGLADRVDGNVRNTWDLSIFRNVGNGWVERDGKWVFDPEDDGDDDYQASTDKDHDFWSEDGTQLKPIPASPDGKHPAKPLKKKKTGNKSGLKLWNAKYNTDDRKRMAKSGEAMDDGSYPVADKEDLANAIRAVGRGSGDHDAIRRHIMKRAKALGASDQIPDNWNADGSMNNMVHLSEMFRNATSF